MKILVIASIFFFISSVLFRMFVFGNITVMGSETRNIEKEISYLEKANQIVKSDIALASSLSSVRQSALESGMVESSYPDFLVNLSASKIDSKSLTPEL